jgi:uncharacterized UPF0146 family protein
MKADSRFSLFAIRCSPDLQLAILALSEKRMAKGVIL